MEAITYPNGTTKEQWDRYEEQRKRFEERMAAERPKRQNFKSHDEFNKAVNEWLFRSSVDAPNKPGYYRANND